ncbi:MAG: FAD-dependent monooxygenase [Chloroflexi bacterium]|nr:FAD-dependent monooxygenase [Chloroflexota bacterium]
MRELPSEVPVLIAGGGPTGLAAAVELGQRGIACLVLEPRETISFDRPRAKTTSVRTMEHFRRWGLAQRIRDVAPLPVAWSQEVVFCTSLLGREITRIGDCFGLSPTRREEWAEAGQQIGQPLVEQVLREALGQIPAVTFATGWSLVELSEQADSVSVRARARDGAEREIRAQYVLGCEGSASPTRAAIGARYAGNSDLRPNFNVVFRAPGLAERVPHGPAVHYWVLNSSTPGALGRMDLHDTWWGIGLGIDAETGDRDPDRVMAGLIGAQVQAELVATDPWTARMLLADTYQTDRVFLVGDAAHLNPPWGGHGFNTGIGDAVNVGWKLAATLNGWGSPELLRSYQAERRPVAQQTIEDATANMSMLSTDLTSLVDDPEAIRRAKDSEFHSMGLVLGYTYADSPVVVGDGTAPPPHDPIHYTPSTHPGARLPHRWLPDGRSLYDALSAELTLLRLSPDADVSAFVEAARQGRLPLRVVDLSELDLAARYAATLLLVRPDQHIAWRTSETRVAGNAAHAILRRAVGRHAAGSDSYAAGSYSAGRGRSSV